MRFFLVIRNTKWNWNNSFFHSGEFSGHASWYLDWRLFLDVFTCNYTFLGILMVLANEIKLSSNPTLTPFQSSLYKCHHLVCAYPQRTGSIIGISKSGPISNKNSDRLSAAAQSTIVLMEFSSQGRSIMSSYCLDSNIPKTNGDVTSSPLHIESQ